MIGNELSPHHFLGGGQSLSVVVRGELGLGSTSSIC